LMTVVLIFAWNLPGAQSSCDGSHSLSNSGTISDGSGEYGDDEQCTWHLHCESSGHHPQLQMDNFATELDYDYVEVLDGDSTSSSRLAKYSGSVAEAAEHSNSWTQTASGSRMTVVFHSDGSVNHGGFSASFTCTHPPGCEDTSSLSNSGTITDGSGSGDYLDSWDCTFHLHCDSGHVPQLHIDNFATEHGYDYLKVLDGGSTSSSQLASYTGTVADRVSGKLDSNSWTQIASGSRMTVTFHTDGSNVHEGFSASFTCIVVCDSGQYFSSGCHNCPSGGGYNCMHTYEFCYILPRALLYKCIYRVVVPDEGRQP
jgi:hypothetical protein